VKEQSSYLRTTRSLLAVFQKKEDNRMYPSGYLPTQGLKGRAAGVSIAFPLHMSWCKRSHYSHRRSNASTTHPLGVSSHENRR
jgi:hypothetical protein